MLEDAPSGIGRSAAAEAPKVCVDGFQEFFKSLKYCKPEGSRDSLRTHLARLFSRRELNNFSVL